MSLDEQNAANGAAQDQGQGEQGGESIRPPIVFDLKENSRYEGALFNIEDPVAKGPVMSGSITVGKDLKVPLSAFKEISESNGSAYLNLSLGSAGGVHYHGRLFRHERRSEQSPDYSGYVRVLPVPPGVKYSTEEWEKAPKLQVFGRRKRNSTDGKARIDLELEPTLAKVEADELPL